MGPAGGQQCCVSVGFLIGRSQEVITSTAGDGECLQHELENLGVPGQQVQLAFKVQKRLDDNGYINTEEKVIEQMQ